MIKEKREVIYVGVANYKGGTGKTMTAINLAYSFARENLKVVVIDDDKNRTSKNWSIRRGVAEPFPVLTMMEAQRYADEKDVVIYDTPGGMGKSDINDLQQNCSFIVVPCKPDRGNLDTTESLASDLKEFGAQFRVLVTDAMAAGNFARARALIEYFKQEGIPHFSEIIPRSAKMLDASDSGLAVGEISGGRFIADKYSLVARRVLSDVKASAIDDIRLTPREIETLTSGIEPVIR